MHKTPKSNNENVFTSNMFGMVKAKSYSPSPVKQKSNGKVHGSVKKEESNTFKSKKSSIKSNLKFHLSQNDNEESLERIHTFNLKSPNANNRQEFSAICYSDGYDDKEDNGANQKRKDLRL